jgi:hypothetical protein
MTSELEILSLGDTIPITTQARPEEDKKSVS